MRSDVIPPPAEVAGWAEVGPAIRWRQLVSGFGLLAGGEVIARVLGLAATIAMAHALDPDSFGLVVIGTTLLAWTALSVDAGTELLGVRELGRDPTRLRAVTAPLLGMRLAMALALGSCILAVTVAGGAGRATQTVALFALVLPALALNPRYLAVSVRASRAVAVGNVVGQLVLLGGVLVFVGAGDAREVPLLVAVGETCYATLVLTALWRLEGFFLPRLDLPVWWLTLRSSGPLLAYQLTRAVIYSADVLLIGVLLTHHDAGHYGAAYKPVLFISGGIGLFYVSFLATHENPGTPGASADLARRALRVVPAVVLACALLLSLSAPVLVPAIYGSSFRPAAAALSILAWTLPLQAVGGVYTSQLISAGCERTLLRNNLFAATGNVAANLAAIPLLGIAGAAAVTVATELVVLVANRRAARRRGLGATHDHRPARADLAARTE